ncbi:MAG TPA: hypothetical protein VGM78_07140 [Ilumatobacteraceae bacterium]
MTDQPEPSAQTGDDVAARVRAALDELTADMTTATERPARRGPRAQPRRVQIMAAAAVIVLVVAAAVVWLGRDERHGVRSSAAATVSAATAAESAVAVTDRSASEPSPPRSPTSSIAATTVGASASTTNVNASTTFPPELEYPNGSTTISMPGTPPQYQAIGTIIESAPNEAELCIGGIKESAPPQCGGPRIINWDWTAAPGVQSLAGVRWIDRVLLTGTFDGTIFTETYPPRAPTAADDARFEVGFAPRNAPCAAPAGGWEAAAAQFPSDVAPEDAAAAVAAYAATQPDYGGGWVDRSLNTSTAGQDANDPRHEILVEQFTGDLPAHETALRALWPGALCVTLVSHTAADLDAIRTRIEADATRPTDGSLPTVLDVAVDVANEAIDVGVVIATPAVQSELEARYGVDLGLLVLRPSLLPAQVEPS